MPPVEGLNGVVGVVALFPNTGVVGVVAERGSEIFGGWGCRVWYWVISGGSKAGSVVLGPAVTAPPSTAVPLETRLPEVVVGELPDVSIAAAAAATLGKPPSPGGTGEFSFGGASAGVLIA